METAELLEIIAKGEDSKHQFKVDVTNAQSLGGEIVAFSNSGGGQIFIGIADDGSVRGLDSANVGRINQLIANAASDCVRPPVNPVTENIHAGGGIVIVVTVADGLAKPYLDNSGIMWVKSGSDKRRVTAREEMQRMFQAANLVHADDIGIRGSSAADIDLDYFKRFFKSSFGHDLEYQELPLARVLTNMRLAAETVLTLSGVLLFAKEPRNFLPVFHIKAVCYPGNDVHSTAYLDSVDIHGRLQTQFEEAMGFMLRNLRRDQNAQSINSLGEIEIPRIVLEELLANALIHRDYFVSAPIRIFVYENRIEIVSPGHLPNNLTVENIQSGNSNIRNPILTSHATKLIPYRGLGSGILRALKEYPHINFRDDRDKNLFAAIIHRIKR